MNEGRKQARRRRKALAKVQELKLFGPLNVTWTEAARSLGAALFTVPRYDRAPGVDYFVHPDYVPAIRTLLACRGRALDAD